MSLANLVCYNVSVILLITGIIDVSEWSKEHIDELEDLVKRAEQEILTRPSPSKPQQNSEFQTVRKFEILKFGHGQYMSILLTDHTDAATATERHGQALPKNRIIAEKEIN